MIYGSNRRRGVALPVMAATRAIFIAMMAVLRVSRTKKDTMRDLSKILMVFGLVSGVTNATLFQCFRGPNPNVDQWDTLDKNSRHYVNRNQEYKKRSSRKQDYTDSCPLEGDFYKKTSRISKYYGKAVGTIVEITAVKRHKCNLTDESKSPYRVCYKTFNTTEKVKEKSMSDFDSQYVKLFRGDTDLIYDVRVSTKPFGIIVNGATVTRVDAGTPAEEAGVRVGSEIIAINDIPVNAENCVDDLNKTQTPFTLKLRLDANRCFSIGVKVQGLFLHWGEFSAAGEWLPATIAGYRYCEAENRSGEVETRTGYVLDWEDDATEERFRTWGEVKALGDDRRRRLSPTAAHRRLLDQVRERARSNKSKAEFPANLPN